MRKHFVAAKSHFSDGHYREVGNWRKSLSYQVCRRRCFQVLRSVLLCWLSQHALSFLMDMVFMRGVAIDLGRAALFSFHASVSR